MMIEDLRRSTVQDYTEFFYLAILLEGKTKVWFFLSLPFLNFLVDLSDHDRKEEEPFMNEKDCFLPQWEPPYQPQVSPISSDEEEEGI